MCGIYGTFHFEDELNLSDSIKALTMLEHRGPDGFGVEYGHYSRSEFFVHHNRLPEDYCSGKSNYFLGHRRLSIIDLNDNAFQPMESSDKKYSIIFNGEIYNYIELWEELLGLGCTFDTDHSDTEVLLNSYATWGTDCLNKLRGMFAFAIYDRENNTLFIARDRIGQKTLYYEFSEHQFTFSSELPPIIKFGQPREVNDLALNLYMALGYIPQPYTIYDNINKLPPATYALVDLENKDLKLYEYWDIESEEDTTLSIEEIVKLTQSGLAESVRYRLRADVSVGAFISGGVDSTLIVKNIAETGNKKFDIYGADFPNTDRSEKKYIVEAAKKYSQNLKLSNIDLTHIKNIEEIIKVFDEPFDGVSSIALFDLFKEASKKHKVILTGDGGDELFAGYTRYLSFPKKQALINLLNGLVFPKLLLSILLFCGIKHNKLLSLKTLLDGDVIDNFTGINDHCKLTTLIKPGLVRSLSEADTFKTIKSNIHKKAFSSVKALQYLEIKTILPGRMLYKLDRFSMFYGVEARSPFLDHKLVEMAFTIPDNVNISNNMTKVVLKTLLSQDFDKEFVHREKQGFGNPLSYWFSHSGPGDILSILLKKDSFVYNYLDYDKTLERFPIFKNGHDGLREKDLWRLLVIAHFLENNREFIRLPE